MTEKTESFTGGYWQTNAFSLPTPGGGRLLIDAPEGSADWVRDRGWRLEAILLTHAHVDHIHDCAALLRTHGCPVYYHKDGVPLLEDTMAYRRYGITLDFEPVTGGEFIAESQGANFAGLRFDVLEVPGHCPGSVCFHDVAGRLVYAGDTLFAGTIGRTDLPGGNHALLLRCIREKLMTLDDDIAVFPGHGPATTIGAERRSNPFLAA